MATNETPTVWASPMEWPEKETVTGEEYIELHESDGDYRVTAKNLVLFMVGASHYYYNREELPTPNRTSITIHANTQVNINGVGYVSDSDVELSTSDVAEAGKDVYIYACQPKSGSEPVFVLSQNSTVPDGYDADSSRKIGGFHCLCESVGVISGHPLSGYVTGDILPASVWDLKHRPVSDSEGMVYDEGTGRWYDIYLASWDGEKLVSAYGAAQCSGTRENPFHGLKFKEYMGKIGKRLLWRHEFMCVADGSNQCTHVNDGTDVATTGGHVDENGRRMISNIGLEDCCGAFYQWVNDEYEHYIRGAGSASTISYFNTNSTNRYFSNYGWTDAIDSEGEPRAAYNETIEDEKKGDTYGMPRQACVGGTGGTDSARCGSRCVNAAYFGSSADSNRGARGASEPRVA